MLGLVVIALAGVALVILVPVVGWVVLTTRALVLVLEADNTLPRGSMRNRQTRPATTT